MKGIAAIFLNFILKIGLLFWLFSLCRILFFVFNSSYFPNPQLINFLGGIRFDWMTITIIYSPYLLSLLVFTYGERKWQRILYYISTLIIICLNFIDFEYFKYTQKRTTFDLFTTEGLNNELSGLLLTFAKDFWYLILIAIVTFFATKWLFKKTIQENRTALNWKQYLTYSLVLVLVYFLGSRGGAQLRPLNVIAASQYSNAQNIPLVLNTPFTVLKSSYKKHLKQVSYYNEKELDLIYSPEQIYISDGNAIKPNVVLLIAESFSAEYIGTYNQGVSYTPFLDSLFKESLVFTNSFANGKKSIEALPAILSGVPTLMNNAYISSLYAGNKIESLPSKLEELGYETQFFHGGANGTMGFNSFTQIAGIDKYYGKNEFPIKSDYDGKWGIFDEPFLQFTAKELSKNNKPFFAGIFSLSSHHPYSIPEKYINKFPKGELPIHESIGYADYALKRFFDSAKKEEWFDNTIFIITADHTQQNSVETFNNPVGMYRVPIVFYSPKYIKASRSSKVISQVDIYPTVIDIINQPTNVLSFGKSVFSNELPNYSVSYINGIYQLISETYCLQFDGENVIGFYNWQKDNPLHNNLVGQLPNAKNELVTYLKAYIQQYNSRLITNKLTSN